MLEHRAVAMPADPGPGIVADKQGLDEFGGVQVGEPRRPRLQKASIG